MDDFIYCFNPWCIQRVQYQGDICQCCQTEQMIMGSLLDIQQGKLTSYEDVMKEFEALDAQEITGNTTTNNHI